jgi:hypothetical protein
MRSVAWLALAALPVLAACRQEVPTTLLAPYHLGTEVPPAPPAPPPKPVAKLPMPERKPQPPADLPDVSPPSVPATADAGPQATDTATLDAPAPVGPGQGTGSAPVPVPPAPGSEDVASLLDPGQLIGLDLAGIARLLGQPALQSERPPAKVWSYNGDGCSLRVFVYPDINTRLFRALTYDIQGTDGSPVAKRRCFTGLVKQHAT